MIFPTKLTVMALAAMFLFVGHASALTKNPVDACKDKKDDVGHSCAYDSSHGKVEGRLIPTIDVDDLVCIPFPPPNPDLTVSIRTIAEECLRQYRPYRSWDSAAFDRLILHGLRENEADPHVHLKTSSINETVLYADPITPSMVYGLLHQLDAGIQLNWVLPENGGQRSFSEPPLNTQVYPAFIHLAGLVPFSPLLSDAPLAFLPFHWFSSRDNWEQRIAQLQGFYLVQVR
ncbi:hypothetical protein EDD18DRAFT_1461148 [Armillaria luteobubalina]|uniref:Uncharacterized protein n=1 Tax=Armillaria luteobubalina TaxID=153913 RepID=A0AA39QAE6_9AGAR|nr:hypothetical protein EDD18DRAFT_1461148 [Armillaria luteobubalina]